MICRNCNAEAEPLSIFCTRCGYYLRFKSANVLAVPIEQRCAACKAEISESWRFCKRCGFEVNRLARPRSRKFVVRGTRLGVRPRNLAKYMRLGTEVLLVREPANENDPSAILVVFPNGAEVGYVPREDAVDLAPLLDYGCKYQAHIDVIIPAEAGKLPEVQAFFFPPDSTGPEAESAHVATVAPARVQTSRFAANGETGVGQKTAGCALRSGTGCLVVLFSLVILVGVLRLLGITS